MLLANTLGSLLLLPALFLYGGSLRGYSAKIWVYLALTGLFQAVYYLGLANAYRCGDMSIAYPLLRAIPVLMVAGLTALLQTGSALSSLAVSGMVIVVLSCLVLPMQRFSEIRLKNYWNLVSLFALLAACGTTGYTLVDSEALKLARSAAAPLPGAGVTAVYALIEGLITSAWLGVLIFIPKIWMHPTELGGWHPPPQRFALRRTEWKSFLQALQMGAGIYAAYTLVLVAMGYVSNVSYAIAFRQLSIPLGAMLGITMLREPRPLTKMVGILGVFLGLVLVGFG